MRILLDTNVLIAAFITQGACSVLFEHIIRRHELVASEFILSELLQHLVGKFRFEPAEAEEVVELLRSRATIVSPLELDDPVCRDPDDDTILGTAIAGAAICIVTGDKDLLVLKRFESIDIVSPSTFSDYEAQQGTP